MAARFLDLAAMAAWCVATVVAVLADGPLWLTAVLGLPYVLLLPGMAILATSHPDADDRPGGRSMRMADRLAWGLLLSLLVALLAGLGLETSSNGLTRTSATITLAAITLLFTVLGAIVRSVERAPVARTSERRHWTWMEVASLALVVVLAAGVAFVAVDAMRTASDRGHTVLAFVDPAPLLCHPLEWRDGALRHASAQTRCAPTANLTVGVANREGQAMDYRMVAGWDTVSGDEVPAFVFTEETFALDPVDDDELTVQRSFRLDVPPPPDAARSYLKVVLFKDGGAEPSLYLQVRVDRK